MSAAPKKIGWRATLPADLLASLVVFLVALPLCMGIALASGMPPAAGLVSGVVGGLVVGSLAGSPLQVTGPAAGLAVLVWEIVRTHGPETLAVMLLIAGALQIAAGALRLGRWFRAVSPAVVTGMLAGIGVLIFAAQVHVLIDDVPRTNGLANVLAFPEAVGKALGGGAHQSAALVGLATLIAMIAWKMLRPRKLHFLPEALIGVVLGTVLTGVFDPSIKHVVVPDSLADAVRLPSTGAFAALGDPSVWIGIVTIAFVASAETLLSAAAVDRLHGGQPTKFDKELVAQGVGNTLCGVLGALPVTGVIVRSSANVAAGARTRASAILHGAWLLVFVAALPFVLRFVPMASLAAILVYTGAKLIDWNAMAVLRRYGRGEIAICVATMAGIVAFDLLTGVLIGLGLAVARLLYQMSHLRIDVEERDELVTVRLHGAATFVGIPKLAASLEQIPGGKEVHIQVADLTHVDHAALELLSGFEKRHALSGGDVLVEWRDLERLSKKGARKPQTTASASASAQGP